MCITYAYFCFILEYLEILDSTLMSSLRDFIPEKISFPMSFSAFIESILGVSCEFKSVSLRKKSIRLFEVWNWLLWRDVEVTAVALASVVVVVVVAPAVFGSKRCVVRWVVGRSQSPESDILSGGEGKKISFSSLNWALMSDEKTIEGADLYYAHSLHVYTVQADAVVATLPFLSMPKNADSFSHTLNGMGSNLLRIPEDLEPFSQESAASVPLGRGEKKKRFAKKVLEWPPPKKEIP